jgi:hypothetical protein
MSLINFRDIDEFDSDNDMFIGHEMFYNFLVDNNILDKFLSNFNSKLNRAWLSYYGVNNLSDYFNFLDKIVYNNGNVHGVCWYYFSFPFDWSRTKEGFSFWEKYRDKLRLECQ